MSVFAYIHLPKGSVDAKDVFYVGKGSAKRARNMSSRSEEHKERAATLENVDIGMMECSTHEIAYELERGLIKCLQRAGADLVNKTAGGGGLVGYTMPEEARKKLSDGKLGEKNPMKRPEVVAKMLETKKPNLKIYAKKAAETRALPENRERISAAQARTWQNETIRAKRLSGLAASGALEKAAKRFRDNNPSATLEGRKLRSEQSIKRWADPDLRRDMVESIKRSWNSERKLNMSLNNPSHSAEVNAKKSMALKGIKAPVVKCPHCNLEGGENIMKRWHFDRCKNRSV